MESIPAVAEARERLEAAVVETEVRGEVDEDGTRGLSDAAANLAVTQSASAGEAAHRPESSIEPGATAVLLRAEVPVVVAGDPASRDPLVGQPSAGLTPPAQARPTVSW